MFNFPKSFTITEDHLKLLARLEIGYDEWTEYGAPEVDPKRPYGNSDVENDIAEILEWELVKDRYGDEILTEEQGDRAKKIHMDMTVVLAIMCNNPTDFKLGTYAKTAQYGASYRLVE